MLLFDGENMDAWRNYQKDKVGDGWKVVDGEIPWFFRASGEADEIEVLEQLLCGWLFADLMIDLELDPWTLILELHLAIMKIYLNTKNEVCSSRCSKVIAQRDT